MKDFPPEEVKKILVMAFQGIGNILLLTPALEALHQNYPQAKFTAIVTSPGTAELLKGCPYVERVILYDSGVFWKGSLFKKLSFVKDLRNQKFDMTFSTFLESGFKSGLLAFLTGAPVRVGYNLHGRGFFYTHRLDLIPNRHEVELGLDLVRALGGRVTGGNPLIWLLAEERRWVEKFLKEKGIAPDESLIGIHPGSSPTHPEKRWDLDRFAKLADHIMERKKTRVLILGGDLEVELARRMKELMHHSPLVAMGQTLRQTAALLTRCDLLVSNDTSLSHLATAVETPVIAIFGPTNPWKNRPYGEKSRILRKELPCSPCYETWAGAKIVCTNPDSFACLKGIAVEEVLEEALKQLGAQQA
ncbi:MAG: glycosyltransferase family 9 protein [Candidatus Omnitrophica bacterium]|nr:glycosyltransferase family 9 protein [Candidatus Omnitrophota bacterium]